LLYVHLKALFETIINELPEECLQIKEYWDKLNLDELFALVICKDNHWIMLYLDISSILDEVPNEGIGVLKDVVTKNDNLNIDGIAKLMKVAHPYLKKKISTDSKNHIDLENMTNPTITIPNIKSKLKFTEETKEMYQNFKLHKGHDDKIISLERLKKLYKFKIHPDKIIIHIPQLYELLLKVTYYDEKAMLDLLELLKPIFTEITGAQKLLDISRL
jgi:hypothetical protein